VNKKQKQTGFAHFMIITTILVIALIGTLGFIFYQNVISKKAEISKVAETKKTDTPTTDKTDTSSTTAKVTTPTPDTKNTLKIGDWGVKGEYHGSHSITYEIRSGNTITFINSDEISADCTEGIAKIVRLKPDDDMRATMVNGGYVDSSIEAPKVSQEFAVDKYTDTQANKHVGNYYYYLAGPAQYCPSAVDASLQKNIFVDIMAYFKTLEATE